MKTSKYLLAAAAFLGLLIPAYVIGGGARAGGGALHALAAVGPPRHDRRPVRPLPVLRPAPPASRPAAAGAAFDRTPSMSRSAPPAAQRPAAASPAQRPAQPAAAQRPANNIANRPAINGGNPAGGSQPGNSIANRPAVGGGSSNAGQRPIASQPSARPSQDQLSGFLNLPQQSAADARPLRAQPASGSGRGRQFEVGHHAGRLDDHSRRRQGLHHDRRRHDASAGAAGGIKIVKGGRAATADSSCGGGTASRAGQRPNARRTRRSAPAGPRPSRARTATRPSTSAADPWAAASQMSVPQRPSADRAETTIAAGRGASFVNGQFVGGQAWRAVNANFTYWHNFTPGWYARYPGCWWPGKWAIATTAWATATWAVAGSYCGCTAAPIYYDYSQNVVYDQGTVYYGDQPVATAQQYYDEAATPRRCRPEHERRAMAAAGGLRCRGRRADLDRQVGPTGRQ